MIAPLTINALVLRSLRGGVGGDRARAASSALLVAQLADLDRWLAEELDVDRCAELAARGRDMDPRQVQSLTHAVAGRHLDLAG